MAKKIPAFVIYERTKCPFIEPPGVCTIVELVCSQYELFSQGKHTHEFLDECPLEDEESE